MSSWHVNWWRSHRTPSSFRHASRKALVSSAAVQLLIVDQQGGACLQEGILHKIRLVSGCIPSCNLLAAWFWQEILRGREGEMQKHTGALGTPEWGHGEQRQPSFSGSSHFLHPPGQVMAKSNVSWIARASPLACGHLDIHTVRSKPARH